MNKNKRIIISLIISLALLIVFNIVYSKYVKPEDIQAYMLVEDVIKGEKLSSEKLKKVNLSTAIAELEFVTEIDNAMYAEVGLKKRTTINQAKYRY